MASKPFKAFAWTEPLPLRVRIVINLVLAIGFSCLYAAGWFLLGIAVGMSL